MKRLQCWIVLFTFCFLFILYPVKYSCSSDMLRLQIRDVSFELPFDWKVQTTQEVEEQIEALYDGTELPQLTNVDRFVASLQREDIQDASFFLQVSSVQGATQEALHAISKDEEVQLTHALTKQLKENLTEVFQVKYQGMKYTFDWLGTQLIRTPSGAQAFKSQYRLIFEDFPTYHGIQLILPYNDNSYTIHIDYSEQIPDLKMITNTILNSIALQNIKPVKESSTLGKNVSLAFTQGAIKAISIGILCLFVTLMVWIFKKIAKRFTREKE